MRLRSESNGSSATRGVARSRPAFVDAAPRAAARQSADLGRIARAAPPVGLGADVVAQRQRQQRAVRLADVGPAAGVSPRRRRRRTARRARISLRVSVPVLSEQMTVTEPSVSTAGSRRISAFRAHHALARRARAACDDGRQCLRDRRRPPGSERSAASAAAARRAAVRAAKTTTQIADAATASCRPNAARRCCSGVRVSPSPRAARRCVRARSPCRWRRRRPGRGRSGTAVPLKAMLLPVRRAAGRVGQRRGRAFPPAAIRRSARPRSTRSSTASSSRMSAGTALPASSSTMSPGTSARRGDAMRPPVAHDACARGRGQPLQRGMARSARYSCTKPTTAFSTTMPRMTTVSSGRRRGRRQPPRPSAGGS